MSMKPLGAKAAPAEWPPIHRRAVMLGSLFVAIAASTLLYMHALAFPSCCDAQQYVEMARYYQTSGLSPYAPHSDVRTFGYPLFLSLAFRAANATGVSQTAVVFLIQLIAYFGLVVLLYRRVSQSFGANAGWAVYYGLVFNVLLLPYLSLTLTDGFSVILLLAAAAMLTALPGENRTGRLMIGAALLGLLIGFAVVVRPANLWFGSLIVVGALLVRHTDRRRAADLPGARARPRALLFAAICLAASFAATLPQSALNWTRARQVSPLPIYDLKAKQIDGGIRYVKYGTSMADGAAGLFYANPLFPATEVRQGIDWYFREPLRGGATVALRIFGGFDFDYLFPYVYDLRPSYRPVLFLLSQFIVFFGFGGVLLLAMPAVARRVLGDGADQDFTWNGPISAGQLFVPVLAAWFAIYGVSAIENRFALPMVTLLMPVALAALRALAGTFRSGSVRQGTWVVAGFAAWIALAVPLAMILERAKAMPPA